MGKSGLEKNALEEKFLIKATLEYFLFCLNCTLKTAIGYDNFRD